MAINILTTTTGAIYLQTGVGVPNHVAPRGSQFTNIQTGDNYRNLDGGVNWEKQISFTGETNDISGFTTFNSTTPNQSEINANIANDTLNFSGSNIGIYTNPISKIMTFSANTDGSYLTNIPISSVNSLDSTLDNLNDSDIDSFSFDQSASTITISLNGGLDLPIDVSSLSNDTFIISGLYQPNSEEIIFTNNTGGTFSVSGITTGMTDSFVDGGVFNDTTYSVGFTKNDGPGFNLDLIAIKNDITATTLNLQNQINTKSNEVDFITHTGNTSIHFTKSSINLSDLGSSGHTHPIQEINGLEGELDGKLNVLPFNTHTGDTSNPHFVTFNDLINTAHTHTISEIDGLQDALDSTDSFSALTESFISHTGNTDIHFTKSSINLSDLGNSAHTHTISDVDNLQGELDTLTDGLNERVFNFDFATHTGDTNIHFTKSSINLSELGDSAHTHTISDVDGLGSALNTLNDGVSANTSNIISGVTFDDITNLLTLYRNGDIPFFADLSSLTSDIYTVSGIYSGDSEEIIFTNNTGGTFSVSGITTGMTDSFVDSGSINTGSYEVTFNKNIGLGFNLDLSNIKDDFLSGDTFLQNQINLHVGDGNNPHGTTFNNLLNTAHTHTISDVSNLVNTLNTKLDISDFTTHTGDTDIHFTKSSINLSDLGNSAHTHTINEIDNLQGELDSKTNNSEFSTHVGEFNTHTGDTNIHFTKSSINLSELGNSAHTHTINEIDNLQGELDNKLDLSGGTLSGSLSAITYLGDGSNLSGIESIYTTGMTYNDSNIITLGLNNGTKFNADITNMSGVTVGGLISGSSLSINGSEIMTRIPSTNDFRLIANGAATGVIEYNGLGPNINNGSNFDLGATKGWIVDNITDPNNPIATYIDFIDSNVSNPNGVPLEYLATNVVTYIGITGSSVDDIVQSTSPFTPSESRTTLVLGVVIHSDNVTINAINNRPKLLIDDMQQGYDFFQAVGPFNLDDGGNVFSPNGNNLNIDKSDGRVFSSGSNYIIDPRNPHIISLPSDTALTFRYRLQNSVEFPNTTNIDSTNYDLNGVLTPVPQNKFTVQRLTLFANNVVRAQYGQTVYDSLDDAEASIPTEDFIIEQNFKENGLLRGFIVTKAGCDDLSDKSQARFINAPQFGNASEVAIGDTHRTQILNDSSTGLRGGGLITITGVNEFSIGAGSGQIIDNYSDPMNPEFIDVVWDEIPGNIVADLSAYTYTYVSVDVNGNVVQYPGVVPSPEDKRGAIILGVVSHQFGTSLVDEVNAPISTLSPINQLEDISSAIGPFSIKGNKLLPVPGTLELEKTNGESYFFGRNFQTNPANPSVLVTPSLFSPNLIYATATSFIPPTTNVIDVTQYDEGGLGVLVNLGGGRTSAHRIWHLPGSNALIFQYGQVDYKNRNEAVERFSGENYIIPDGLEVAAYLLAIVICEEDESDLDDPTKSVIIPQGKFAGSGGSGGGGNADTLQSTYNNSSSPQIITDNIRQSVDIRIGTGDNSDNLLQLQDTIGTTNAWINGLGDASFNNITSGDVLATSLTGDGFGITNLNVLPIQQIKVVGKSGATFNTIQSAIDDITDATLEKQYLIDVGPGVYIEDVVMKPFVSVVGKGLSTIVSPTTPNGVIFECSGAYHSNISTLSVSGATASGGTAFNVDSLIPEDGVTIDNITLYSNYRFINMKSPIGTISTLSVRSCIIPPSSVFSVAFDIGGLGINNLDISGVRGSLNSLNSGILLRGSGPNNVVSASDVGLLSLGTPRAFEISDGITLITQAINLNGFGEGLVITDSGVGPKLSANELILTNIEGLSVDIRNQNTIGSIGGSWGFDKLYVEPDTTISLSFSDPGDNNIAISVLGDIYQAENTERILNLSSLVRKSSTLGLVSGGTLSVDGGLNLNVSGGNGFLFNENINEVLETNWSATTISLTDNVKNFIFVNENLNVTSSPSAPNIGNSVFLGIANTLEGEIEFIERNELSSLIHGNRVEDYLRGVLGVRYLSGSLLSEGTTPRTLDVGSGKYNFGTSEFSPIGGSEINFTQYYKDGSGSWVTSTETQVNNTNYDDGSGTLTNLTSNYYAKHTLYTVGDGLDEGYMLVIGQEEFSAATTAFGAELGPIPIKPDIFDGTSVALLGSIIVREGDSNIFQIQDLRSVSVSTPQGSTGGGTGGGVTFHGDLTGLLNDDHSQYLLVNGSRPMSSDLDLGGNNITNLNLVDGIDVSNHSSRHLPNGSDPIETGVASTIGLTNSIGVANKLARQDHIHAHGDQIGGSLHSVATQGVNGFMSSTDKTLSDNLFLNGILNIDLSVNNITTGVIDSSKINTSEAYVGDLTLSGGVIGNLVVDGYISSDIYSGNSTATFYGDGSNLSGVANDTNNIGGGLGILSGVTSGKINAKTLVAGPNITILSTPTTLTIESSGGGSNKIESSIVTTTVIPTELEKIDTLNDNSTNIVDVYVQAYQTTSGGVWGVWKRTLVVTKTSGTVLIREINADVDKTSSDLTATSVTFSVNGGDIDISVTGVLGTTIEWASAYEIII